MALFDADGHAGGPVGRAESVRVWSWSSCATDDCDSLRAVRRSSNAMAMRRRLGGRRRDRNVAQRSGLFAAYLAAVAFDDGAARSKAFPAFRLGGDEGIEIDSIFSRSVPLS
jgi:hypothetical protein